jgi:hypothetical protein
MINNPHDINFQGNVELSSQMKTSIPLMLPLSSEFCFGSLAATGTLSVYSPSSYFLANSSIILTAPPRYPPPKIE